jgi:hypothetical protein
MSATIQPLHAMTRLYVYENRSIDQQVEIFVRHARRLPVYVVRRSDGDDTLTMNGPAVAHYRSRLMDRGFTLREHHADLKIA